MFRHFKLIGIIFLITILFFNPNNHYWGQDRDMVESEELTYIARDYSLVLPSGYTEIDTSYMDLVPSFTNGQSVIKIFVQPLSGSLSFTSYVSYGNLSAQKGRANFKIVNEDSGYTGECFYKLVEYYRPLIKNRANDMNFYQEIHLHDKSKNKVITIWSKSADMDQWLMKRDVDFLLENIKLQTNQVKLAPTAKKELTNYHINYQGLTTELDIAAGQTMWGRFFPGVPFYHGNYPYMLESEKNLAHKFQFIMSYATFPVDGPFPENEIRQIYQDGRIFMLTLQPFDPEEPDLSWVGLLEILAGQHDEVLKEWAEGLKGIGEPVFVRPLNEMNGDWDPWCTWFYGKDNDLFIEAWQYIYDIFKAEGGENLYFVWNPHDRSYPDFTWNSPHLYYPGDEYVEWIGLTGYNNGTSFKGDVWRGFKEIYDPLYADYMKRYGDKPFMITEFSCNEVGGSKAEWLHECMDALNGNRYPNIRIVNWFDGQDGAWQYQINSSSEAFRAFYAGLKLDNFL